MQRLFGGTYAGRRVLLTGHTGFKGSWLAFWLSEMGAEVTGFALEPPTTPNLFTLLDVESRLRAHIIGDIRDRGAVSKAVQAARPEIIIHMAAQPLVRDSYARPVETFDTNVMGTVNVLEAARSCDSAKAIINVTTDKCYENRESDRAYQEEDALGGHDPYSASKGCSEIVTAAYRLSFLANAGVRVASARAGNVIGGGDWATDRLVPDCIRALTAGTDIVVRNPSAVRPWQHVLEPLSGYLLLGERLLAEGGSTYAQGWNFGPDEDGALRVSDVVDRLVESWGSGSWQPQASEGEPHEAQLLRLDITKAKTKLDWHPQWASGTAIERTAEWYARWHEDENSAGQSCADDLSEYVRSAGQGGAVWASELIS